MDQDLPPADQTAAINDTTVPDLPSWLPEQVEPIWNALLGYPLLAAVVIAAISFLVAKVAEVIICRGIAKLTAKTDTQIDDRLIALVQRPILITLFFCGLTVAVQSLEFEAMPTLVAVRTLRTLVVLAWLHKAFPVQRLILDALGQHSERFPLVEERTIPLFDMLGQLLVLGTASYALLLVWNINPTAWLASASVLGLALGFAAKDSLANLFSGFFIVADAPYTLGDFVVLPTGERGKVTHLGIRSTRLLTRDDIEITVPNAQIANAKIINESGGPSEKERIRIKVGVAYGSDVDQVCAVLAEIATHHKEICARPTPRVRMRGFGASSLDFELLCWIDEPVLRGKLSHLLYMEVYKRFALEGIEIPYTKYDVYVKELPRSPTESCPRSTDPPKTNTAPTPAGRGGGTCKASGVGAIG